MGKIEDRQCKRNRDEPEVAAPGPEAVEVDVFATRGALFVLAEAAHVMVCATNRTVNPGLIFYDMHAVLRDLDRAAAAEERREAAGSEA